MNNDLSSHHCSLTRQGNEQFRDQVKLDFGAASAGGACLACGGCIFA
jgi:hypothetical protein